MENKKGKKILIGLLVIGSLIGIGIFGYQKIRNNKTDPIQEYTPQEEVSEEQLRQTMVTLYYQNKETGKLMPEARLIDVKELAQNPYEKLVTLLMQNPKSDKLEKVIPNDTKLNKAEMQGDILILDFSQEFVLNQQEGKEKEENTIYSIVNTVTELTEVNSVKILINGEENKGYTDEAITFEKLFTKQEVKEE